MNVDTLRQSFASRALMHCVTPSGVGNHLGHSHINTTARYVHLAQDSLHATAKRIAESIAAEML